jgi:hypothetical protein
MLFSLTIQNKAHVQAHVQRRCRPWVECNWDPARFLSSQLSSFFDCSYFYYATCKFEGRKPALYLVFGSRHYYIMYLAISVSKYIHLAFQEHSPKAGLGFPILVNTTLACNTIQSFLYVNPNIDLTRARHWVPCLKRRFHGPLHCNRYCNHQTIVTRTEVQKSQHGKKSSIALGLCNIAPSPIPGLCR